MGSRTFGRSGFVDASSNCPRGSPRSSGDHSHRVVRPGARSVNARDHRRDHRRVHALGRRPVQRRQPDLQQYMVLRCVRTRQLGRATTPTRSIGVLEKCRFPAALARPYAADLRFKGLSHGDPSRLFSRSAGVVGQVEVVGFVANVPREARPDPRSPPVVTMPVVTIRVWRCGPPRSGSDEQGNARLCAVTVAAERHRGHRSSRCRDQYGRSSRYWFRSRRSLRREFSSAARSLGSAPAASACGRRPSAPSWTYTHRARQVADRRAGSRYVSPGAGDAEPAGQHAVAYVLGLRAAGAGHRLRPAHEATSTPDGHTRWSGVTGGLCRWRPVGCVASCGANSGWSSMHCPWLRGTSTTGAVRRPPATGPIGY
jgi:hypothetical protein